MGVRNVSDVWNWWPARYAAFPVVSGLGRMDSRLMTLTFGRLTSKAYYRSVCHKIFLIKPWWDLAGLTSGGNREK